MDNLKTKKRHFVQNASKKVILDLDVIMKQSAGHVRKPVIGQVKKFARHM